MSERSLLLLSALAVCGCGDLWPASMAQQPSVQPLAEARAAPPGAVPLGGVELLEDRDDDSDLKPPFPLDASAAIHGGEIFALRCAPCHGPTGAGGGPVSAKFPPAPDVRHISICRRTDGFLYGTITAGGRAMPSMREGLTARERWELVAHVRALQHEGCTGTEARPDAAPDAPQGATP